MCSLAAINNQLHIDTLALAFDVLMLISHLFLSALSPLSRHFFIFLDRTFDRLDAGFKGVSCFRPRTCPKCHSRVR
jgi:hypothetical protein